MKKYLIITTILVAFLFTSCEEFLDVNTDPNNPTEVTPDLILPVAQTYTATYTCADRRTNHLGNMFMYNWSETYGFSWYDEEFQYLVTTTFYDQLFDNAYENALKQYTDLEGLTEEYGYYKAIAMIMKAYHFQILVDLYGDVPYFDALQRGETPTPKYDDAAAIYADLIVKLNAAIDLIKSTSDLGAPVQPEEDDVIFGGDMTKWIQFANTVKLRIFVRADNTLDASAGISAIEAEGSGYITEDVTVQPGYLKEEGKQNPYWEDLGQSVDGTVRLTNDATCATQYILDYLTTTNDPRIDYMYEEPEDGHLGVDQGTNPGDDHAADYVSNIGPGHLKGPDQPAVIFTLADRYLTEAEAALDGYSSGDAETLYNMGVQASFEYLGLTAADAASYLSQEFQNRNYAASTNKLEAIITQKWLALNGVDAIQSWFDITRTGYPAGLPTSSILAPGKPRPVRLAYPASEVTGNTKNLPSQPDVFTSKIFWAQ